MLPETSFSIIGAGKVGTSIGVLLKRAGHRILGCSARNPESLARAVTYLDCFSSTNIHEVYEGAEAIVIAVPDATIEEVARAIADRGIPEGTICLHAAGSLGLDPLLPLKASGARLAAVHVLQAVPTVEAGLERIPGSWFGCTCEPGMEQWVESYVEALGGRVLWVPEDRRALYHASAAFASNYMVVLAHFIEEMGFDPRQYANLSQGALENVIGMGARKALTGPIVRGDVSTVEMHLDAIAAAGLDEVGIVYRVLGQHALEIARLSEWLNEDVMKKMAQALHIDPGFDQERG